MRDKIIEILKSYTEVVTVGEESFSAIGDDYFKNVADELVEKLNISPVIGVFTEEQMKEAYQDGYENDFPNEWNFKIENYR